MFSVRWVKIRMILFLSVSFFCIKSYDKTVKLHFYYLIWNSNPYTCHYVCVYCVVVLLFLAHLDAAALSVFVSLWICCRCHLAEAVLDNLQCRCCVFSRINTDTQCLLLSHMAQSTIHTVALKLSTIYWAPVMTHHSFKSQGKKEGTFKRYVRNNKANVWEEMRPH